jgi:hypothetical protein
MKKNPGEEIKVSTGARVARSMTSMKSSSITKKAFNPIGNLKHYAYSKKGKKP